MRVWVERGVGVTLAVVAGLSGCAPKPEPKPPAEYRYFVPAQGDDPWGVPIRRWQVRAALEAELGRPVDVAARPSTDLESAYAAFQRERREAVASDILSWIRAHTRPVLLPDADLSRWPDMDELLRTGGDPALLMYQSLRSLGFGSDELYLAVLGGAEGRRHRVALWLDGANGAHVLDPTGAVADDPEPLSSVSEWRLVDARNDRGETLARRWGGPGAEPDRPGSDDRAPAEAP